jgi:hypothetical protein
VAPEDVEPEELELLPRLVPEESELVLELESPEVVVVPVLSLDPVDVEVEVVAAVPVLAARAIAATPKVPPTLSATSAPVAAASRRRPCSLPMCASMTTPSGPAL